MYFHHGGGGSSEFDKCAGSYCEEGATRYQWKGVSDESILTRLQAGVRYSGHRSGLP